jgi:hypothetical protein
MKKFYTILLFLFATVSILAQAPEKMSYQAVLRDASNTLLTNQEVGMQISILQSTANGTAVYVETQTVTSNINGLVTLEIGTGTVVSGDFTTIDWSTDSYFIKTETDPAGGTTYTITGTSQLMSVPFAMYAKTSGNAAPGPQGAQGTQGIQGAAGAAGTDGTNGIQGTQGATGAVGADGAAGTDGTNGTQGTQGATGSLGAQGDVGEKGDTGDQGTPGIQGNIGSVGAVGATGTTGTNGAKGDTGITGDKGDVGEKGIQGIQGATGADGASGETGAMGDMGTTGLQGASGAQGEIGATGPSGATGNTGNTGVGIAQTLSFTSPSLVLSDNGGSIDLTGLINDADSDNSNEIQNLSQVLTQGNSAGAQLKDVTDPTDAQDAATKAYVDVLEFYMNALEARIAALEPTVPNAPTIGTATAGDGQATTSFTAPVNNGGSPITSYTATSSPDNITSTLTQSGSGIITVTGLTNETAYTFTVTATNAIGVSSSSVSSNSVTPDNLPAIGDFRAGGIVFWVDPADNTHGLVCALSDYATQVAWGCYGTGLPSVPNVAYNGGNPVGYGAEIGDGEDNTTGILADCSSSPAALAARSYGAEWFLPSINELNEIYINRATLEAVPGFSAFSNYYWSSTEYDNFGAWFQYFSSGNQYYDGKNDPGYSVRAVRAF